MNRVFVYFAVLFVGLVGVLAVGIPLCAQAQSELRFEVATVRRVDIQVTDKGVPVFPTTGGIGTSDPHRIAYRGTWLKPLIAAAFGVRADQITGPAWLNTERYDVVANIPDGATKEQFNIMLGNLLRDRFHLRFHIDTTTGSVYALRVARNGPKFKQTAVVHSEEGTAAQRAIGAPDSQGFPVLPPNYHGMVGIPTNGEMHVTAQDITMAEFARNIENNAGRPVIDETSLAGHYDFKLHHEWIRRGPADAAAAQDPHPSIFEAVENQLGLKLESSTSALAQLTIDSIDRDPGDN